MREVLARKSSKQAETSDKLWKRVGDLTSRIESYSGEAGRVCCLVRVGVSSDEVDLENGPEVRRWGVARTSHEPSVKSRRSRPRSLPLCRARRLMERGSTGAIVATFLLGSEL